LTLLRLRAGRFRSRFENLSGFVRAARYTGFYLGWVVASRLIVLTLLTYVLVRSTRDVRLQDISEAFSSNEILIAGFSALAFVLIIRFLSPFSTAGKTDRLFSPEAFEARFIPGFLRGSILAWAIALAFLLSGHYRYLGFYIQFEETVVAFASVFLRIAALGCLVYCEEILFRKKILYAFRERLSPAWACVATAIVYCAIKMLQFDLGIMHLTTLFLLSMALALRCFVTGDHLYGAGFWGALLIVFHPLLGLPIFGSSFPGVLMIKYQGSGLEAATGLFRIFQEETDSRTLLFLTGGIGGPLSSFALQFVLLSQVVAYALRLRRKDSGLQSPQA
jgi:hypothetical protein